MFRDVSASIGMARLPLRGAGHELSIERAIVFADRALYVAKDLGRKQAVVVDRLSVGMAAQVGIIESDLIFAAEQGLVSLVTVQHRPSQIVDADTRALV